MALVAEIQVAHLPAQGHQGKALLGAMAAALPAPLIGQVAVEALVLSVWREIQPRLPYQVVALVVQELQAA